MPEGDFVGRGGGIGFPLERKRDLGKRLEKVADLYESRKQAALLSDASHDMLSKYINGTSKIPFERAAKLCGKQGVSLEWLATGQGEMLISDRARVSSPVAEEAAPGFHEEFATITKLPVDASAGGGALVEYGEGGDDFYFKRGWLRQKFGVSEKHLLCIKARGDSMYPTIPDGAAVIIDTSVTAITKEGVYLFVVDELVFLKRLQLFHDGRLRVKSDNPLYDTYDISPDEGVTIKVVGQAKHGWRGFDL